MSFNNKVVLITGAGQGIGAATAIAFAKEGANVVILDNNKETIKNTEKECRSFGNEVLMIVADISKESETKDIIKRTLDKFHKLDALINNAAIIKRGSILDGHLMESYDIVMNTNLRAVMSLTTFAAPYLAETKGSIVNVASAFSMVYKLGVMFGTYSVAKAGVDAFTKLSASELGPTGIRVNAVSPGPVLTNMISTVGLEDRRDEYTKATVMKKSSDAAEVADLILYLASDKAKSITGCCYPIDNGMLLI